MPTLLSQAGLCQVGADGLSGSPAFNLLPPGSGVDRSSGSPDGSSTVASSAAFSVSSARAALASEASGQRGHSISARAGHSPEQSSSVRATLASESAINNRATALVGSIRQGCMSRLLPGFTFDSPGRQQQRLGILLAKCAA
jgi:hypothetical protein